MAEPLRLEPGQRRARPGRPTAARPSVPRRASGASADQLLDRHRPRQLEVAGHAGRGRVVVVAECRRRVARRSVATQHPSSTPARPSADQRVEPPAHSGDGPGRHQREQQVVQLVGVARARAHLVEHDGHRVGVERGQLVGRHRQPVGTELTQAAPQRQRPGAPLLERRVVEIGEGAPAQDRVREGGRLRRLDRVHRDGARLDLATTPRPDPPPRAPRAGSRRPSGGPARGRAPPTGPAARSPGRRPGPATRRPAGRPPPCAGGGWAGACRRSCGAARGRG